MTRSWRIAVPFCALLAFVLSLAPAAAAAAVTAVNWNVTPGASYTVTDNGTQPLVNFNDCLQTNTSYTIPFSVTIESTESYDARFATVGEATQFLSNVTFSPASVSGTSTRTINATVTMRTGSDEVDEPSAPPPNRFGIYLEPSAGGAPLADSFMTVDVGCIESGTTGTPGLPDTGAGGMAAESNTTPVLAIGVLVALFAFASYALRRRVLR